MKIDLTFSLHLTGAVIGELTVLINHRHTQIVNPWKSFWYQNLSPYFFLLRLGLTTSTKSKHNDYGFKVICNRKLIWGWYLCIFRQQGHEIYFHSLLASDFISLLKRLQLNHIFWARVPNDFESLTGIYYAFSLKLYYYYCF